MLIGCSKDSGDTLDLENNHMARSRRISFVKTLTPVNQGS
jgi:hypothetical protein